MGGRRVSFSSQSEHTVKNTLYLVPPHCPVPDPGLVLRGAGKRAVRAWTGLEPPRALGDGLRRRGART